MKYLKVWTNFLDLIRPLEYGEIGRLFEMMLTYAETGAEPSEFEGNERFLWPVAKQQIDLAAAKNEILRQNGRNGGRPRKDGNSDDEKPNETKENQTEPDESNENQTKAYKEKKYKEIERKEKDIDDDDDTRAREEDELIRISQEQNEVLDAAEDAGFIKSDAVRAKLIELYAQHGKQKVLDGIESCVTHGAPNIAYLSAVLAGGPRKKEKTVALLQRDNTGAARESMEQMRAMIREAKAAGNF